MTMDNVDEIVDKVKVNSLEQKFNKEPSSAAFSALGDYIKSTIQNAIENGMKQAMGQINTINPAGMFPGKK